MRRYRSQTSSPRDGDPVSPPPGETTVGLADIHVRPERLRALQPGVVDQLAESIRERGLTHPIVVRPRAAGEYWLVCGLHRLKAAEKNGDAAILCKVLPDDISDDEAELIEIDENLVRADLSPAERARHVGRRKELYEKQHPETKQGKAPGAGRGKGKKRIEESRNEIFPFVADTAAKTGKGRSTVARDATRGERGQEWLDEVIGTSLDQGDEIDALIKLPPSARDALIERACAGEAVSAKARLKELTVTVKHVPAPAAEPNVLRVVQSVKPPEEFDPQSIRDKILALPDIDLNKLQGFFEALQRSHSPEMVELARQVAIEALSEKLERIRCALAWLEGRKPPGFSDTKH